MKKELMALLFGTTLVLAACGGGSGEEDQAPSDDTSDTTEQADDNDGDSASGADADTTAVAEEVFAQNCASCHGSNLEGGMGPALSEIGAKYSEDEILNIIKEGPGNMPKNAAEGADAEAVAAWLAGKK
ncbi:cytochrome c551 [Aureibacillus halotolerans]|uniref:Cytochrome c551 n=1 Tax=Aureibacillus halotolerans TaxID=1508390 RepID=A0A4V3D4Q1_9BACI|nr:c-type cytochrome [Aureibacillus halotolerans]TDQ36947.1 cytochrome c551 [Aureibacillus halotolerans]